MSKPQKVLVCVLCSVERGGWINPFLAQNLITMSHDRRYQVAIEMVIDKCPVDYARNYCIAMARERGAEWLLQIDADQSFWPGYNPLDILQNAAGKEVIGCATTKGFSVERLLKGENPLELNLDSECVLNDGEFFTVTHIGGGALFINRRVWEKIPGPWFKWCQRDDELRTTDGVLTEDWHFCELVRRHGFKVWAHGRVIPHWKTGVKRDACIHGRLSSERRGAMMFTRWLTFKCNVYLHI